MPEPVRAGRRWSPAEDDRLREHPAAPLAELAALTGRSPGAVKQRRHRLHQHGALARRRPRWTPEEDALLRANPALTAPELAAVLGRSAEAVAWRRKALAAGPGRGRPGSGQPKPPRRPQPPAWGAEEDAALLAAPARPARELAAWLGRTVGAVHRRRSQLRKRHGGPDARTRRAGRWRG